MRNLFTPAVFALMCAISAGAHPKDYPLQARIISVGQEMSRQVLYNGTGGSHNTHVMHTIIGDRMYGLTAPIKTAYPSLLGLGIYALTPTHPWLEIGVYSARRVKNGFEFEFQDGKKLRHEVLYIESEEAVPAEYQVSTK